MTRKQLEQKRDRILESIRSIGPVVRGSLAEVYLTCGKENCRCQKGDRHRAFYLSYRLEGKTKVFHVPAGLLDQARQFHENWRRLKKLLEQLADVQVQLWKEMHDEERKARRKRREGGKGKGEKRRRKR